MNQKQANDLATLYHLLRKTPEENFDMDYVIRGSEENPPEEFLYEGAGGTAGGVVGHMAIAFPDRIRLIQDGVLNLATVGIRSSRVRIYHRVFSTFFGVTQKESLWVTCPLLYDEDPVRKASVLARMRKLADKYGYDIHNAT